jgi:2,4-diketo-3-deoxy-L-fuconate hydrolase
MNEIPPSQRRIQPGLRLFAALCCAAWQLGCETQWEPLFDERMAEGTLERVQLHPPERALTFFRVAPQGEARVFLATEYEHGRVQGVDLSAVLGQPFSDPIDAFNQLGYEALLQTLADSPPLVSFDAAELTLPARLADHHIAAGTNFPEHAAEAGVEDGPYLFPKLVAPSEHDATVSAGQALLDYEVEVGWVPLQPLAQGDTPEFVGLVVCNDYTDREVLLRLVNTADVASGDGFTSAKSFPGFLPVGNLFVIPRDYREFAEGVQLRLFVNGWLRQREQLSRGVWGFDEMLAETWRRKERTWAHRGEQVSLFAESNSEISERVLLMSGTPPGVVFNELDVEHKASGFFDWLLFGWGDSVPDHAIDNYIRDARAAGIYLHPGDRVAIHVDGLGVVHNEVVE